MTMDFIGAAFAPGLTIIDVDVTLGSVEIIVPPDLAVEVGMSSLAASVEETTGFEPPDPQRPIDPHVSLRSLVTSRKNEIPGVNDVPAVHTAGGGSIG